MEKMAALVVAVEQAAIQQVWVQQVKVTMVGIVLLLQILEWVVAAVLVLLVVLEQLAHLARVVLAQPHQFLVRLSLMRVVAAVAVLTLRQMVRVAQAAVVLAVFLGAETQLRVL
jgi:hypothetical protein